MISSGDAEGHARPRPEVVGASAIMGRLPIEEAGDVLVETVIYMTEVERSVSIGAVNRANFRNPPGDFGTLSGTVTGRHLVEINACAFLSPEARADDQETAAGIDASGLDSQKKSRAQSMDRDERAEAEEERLSLEAAMLDRTARAVLNFTVPIGPVTSRNEEHNI